MEQVSISIDTPNNPAGDPSDDDMLSESSFNEPDVISRIKYRGIPLNIYADWDAQSVAFIQTLHQLLVMEAWVHAAEWLRKLPTPSSDCFKHHIGELLGASGREELVELARHQFNNQLQIEVSNRQQRYGIVLGNCHNNEELVELTHQQFQIWVDYEQKLWEETVLGAAARSGQLRYLQQHLRDQPSCYVLLDAKLGGHQPVIDYLISLGSNPKFLQSTD